MPHATSAPLDLYPPVSHDPRWWWVVAGCLVVAAGADQSWFGSPHFAEYAPGMKTIDDALELRGRIYGAFEMAEVAAASGRHEAVPALLTFVVVGAGPTGVEMAGQIQELSDQTLKGSFRHIDPTEAKVILLDAADAQQVTVTATAMNATVAAHYVSRVPDLHPRPTQRPGPRVHLIRHPQPIRR